MALRRNFFSQSVCPKCWLIDRTNALKQLTHLNTCTCLPHVQPFSTPWSLGGSLKALNNGFYKTVSFVSQLFWRSGVFAETIKVRRNNCTCLQSRPNPMNTIAWIALKKHTQLPKKLNWHFSQSSRLQSEPSLWDHFAVSSGLTSLAFLLKCRFAFLRCERILPVQTCY